MTTTTQAQIVEVAELCAALDKMARRFGARFVPDQQKVAAYVATLTAAAEVGGREYKDGDPLVTELIWEVDRAVKQAMRENGHYDTVIRHILNKHLTASAEVGEFCRHCGASIPHRDGEGRCPKCAHHSDPALRDFIKDTPISEPNDGWAAEDQTYRSIAYQQGYANGEKAAAAELERWREIAGQGVQIEFQLRKEMLTLEATTIERCAQVVKERARGWRKIADNRNRPSDHARYLAEECEELYGASAR